MEPRKGGARVPRAVSVLAGLLERAAERGDAEGDGGAAPAPASLSPSAFRGKALPAIPVRRYAERIYRYAGCSPACFVVAYVYLDRLAQRPLDGEEEGEEGAEVVGVDSYSVHRLLITAVMVAAKFMDDMHFNNAYFARVGGVEVAEMNGLELELLFALRFRLNVTPDTFARYCAALEGQMLEPMPPTAALAPAAAADEEEEAERRRSGGDHQAALRLIRKTKDGAATAVRRDQAGVGSRAAAGGVSVVPRAAVEMIAR
ncbi:cyclin-P4-1-like [Panicum miliaceum]|uniref:Cyclin-P4-1-like n=1 Tax=Panicum miliaceum TaxID=4540 RepID=A0A3L6RUQ4_PANMI|nr:cyclin-P4-1-like [Panicum miliaceum]